MEEVNLIKVRLTTMANEIISPAKAAATAPVTQSTIKAKDGIQEVSERKRAQGASLRLESYFIIVRNLLLESIWASSDSWLYNL